MPQFNSPDDLASAIKAKYPAYQAVPNDQLASKMLAKYPEYWQHVNAANFAAKGMWQPASSSTHPVSTGQVGPESGAGKFMESANKTMLSALPVAGMTAGGIAGAPGLATGMAGAAAGAGLGKIAENAIEEKEGLKPKKTAAQEVKSVGGEAAMGAASELGGAAITKGIEKGAAAMAPKLSGLAAKIMARIIKPSARRLIAGEGRAETARQVAQEVGNVAGGATTLSRLGENVQNAIDDLTAKTEGIVDSYKPQEVEVPVSSTGGARGTEAGNGVPTVPASRTLTAGGKGLPAGSDIVPSGPSSLGPAAQMRSTAAGSQAGQTTAKMFVKQGGINLNRILQRSARSAADNLSATEFPDKTKLVKRAAQMIARHAGSSDLTPSEALSLRRWLRGSMKWPRALNGMRDDIYSELNRQIGSFLSPEDRAVFEANNARVHRLILGKDAIDSAQHRALVNPVRMALHGGMGGWAGYEIGGRKGAIAGAALGAATGTVPFQLGEAAVARAGSKAAGAVSKGMAVPLAKEGAKRISAATLLHEMEGNQ